MPRYRDIDHDSGVISYEIGTDWIEVVFASGRTRHYLYTYRSAGIPAVEKMKKLAESGEGLNSFINRFSSRQYERKW
jgi:hypothetical protein